jgi:glucose-1-phosphate adenylyltransferase
MSEASRFGILAVDEEYNVTSFVEKPANPPSNLANMGVYLFSLDVLDKALWSDHLSAETSHDFGKDILPRLVREGKRVCAYPFTGYWVDVGTVNSYWQAHMDLLAEPPPFDLNDRSWITHTRTEERPPVRIAAGATIIDSMITDGCVIAPGAVVERSVLSPGVRVGPGSIVRESIILTESVVQAGAVLERTIVDKRVIFGESCRIGAVLPGEEPVITMVGKNSVVPAEMVIEPGAVIGTDVVASDFPALRVRADSYIETKRLPNEV